MRLLPRPARVVLLVLAVGLAIELLFDPLGYASNIIRVSHALAALPAAKTRWESLAIRDYDIDVKVVQQPTCFMKFTLHVRQEQIVAVTAAKDNIIIDPSSCAYSQFTIPTTFARAAASLRDMDTSRDALTVEFDPKYGFVSRYQAMIGYRIGLFGESYGDPYTEFNFSNFQPTTAAP